MVVEGVVPTEFSASGIIWLPFIGAGLFFIVARFATSSDTRRMIQIGALVMVILGLVMAGTIYNTQIVHSPDADTSQRIRASTLVPALDEGLGENEVLVASHFPESYAPNRCTESGIYFDETGQSWQIQSPPEGSFCIIVSTCLLSTSAAARQSLS